MDDKSKKLSPETQKFLDDLLKEKERMTPKPRDYVPKQTISERFEEWIYEAPRFVIFLCKILYQIFNIGGFVFAIAGGIFSLMCAYFVWKGTMEITGIIYIIIYFALMFIINKFRFILYKINREN